MNLNRTQLLLAITVTLVIGCIAQAGSLEPPAGPVASTMKPLDQVEPRTPIRAADLPLTIDEPGSYYLTEHGFAGTGGTLINITAPDVTLDLMGFSLVRRTGPGPSSTVIHAGAADRLVIKNGSVSNDYGNAVTIQNSSGIVLTNLMLTCEAVGVAADLYTVTGFALRDNIFRGSSIGDSTLWVTAAVLSGSSGVIENNVFTGDGGGLYGVRGSHVTRNTFTGCNAPPTFCYAIENASESLLERNVVKGGFHYGFDVADSNVISNNRISSCAIDGLLVTGDKNLISGNLLVDNYGVGIHFLSGADGNVYRENAAPANGGAGTCGTSGLCDEGNGNTSAGDNFLPGPM